MTPFSKWTRWAAVMSALALLPIGCQPNKQIVEVEPTKVPTALENVRTSLQQLAKTGEMDSGTALIKDEIEKLRGTEGVDVDSLKKDFDDLQAQTTKPAVSAKAKAMLEKLPK